MPFMHSRRLLDTENTSVTFKVTRCGYTGEDGVEIECPPDRVTSFVGRILKGTEVKLAGLVARDILRLEAGMCLAGTDFDESITPIEASLGFVISKLRIQGQKFPGFAKIVDQIRNGVSKKRFGFVLQGLGPVPRPGNRILLGPDHNLVGQITSGTFSPHVNANIAMGYLSGENTLHLKSLAKAGENGQLAVEIRSHTYPVRLVKLPFVSHYSRS